MKKTRLIAAVVAVALLAMGVGYAAITWSQQMNAQVTGDLDNINLVFEPVAGQSGVSVENGIIKLTAPEMSPAYGHQNRTVLVEITNTGSAPAKLTSYKIFAQQNAGTLTFSIMVPGGAPQSTAVGVSEKTVWPNFDLTIPAGGSKMVSLSVSTPYGVDSDADLNPGPFSFSVDADFDIQ